MDSLEQQEATSHDMLRFYDGMANIQELIQIMAEPLANEIMHAQAKDACADGNQRNGYRERTLATSVGIISLRIPKLRRGSYFSEDLLVCYSRVDRAVVAAVSEMVTCGVSTSKVGRVAHAMGIDLTSSFQVFQSRRSLIRMLGAVFAEMDEDGAARRWFAAESIAQAMGPARPKAPEPAYDGVTEEHLRRIIDVVVADTPLEGGLLRCWDRTQARSRCLHQHSGHYPCVIL